MTERTLKGQTFKDFEWLNELNTSGKVDFNQAMNRMLRKAKGELIVSLQDYIEINPDGLKNFWEAYQKNKKTVFTAPVAKNRGTIEWDWRIHKTDCDWQQWEIDWGATPLSAIQEVGGFDERLDEYWGFDNVNLGLRLNMAGYKVLCLPENRAWAFDHDAHEEHPFRKLINPDFHNQRLDEIRRGLKLNYLDNRGHSNKST